MLSQNLKHNHLLGNAFSVDVMIHAHGKEKFVYCSVDNLFTMLLETEGIPLL